MTAKEALAIISKNYSKPELDLFNTIAQVIEELEAIKSAESGKAMEAFEQMCKSLNSRVFRTSVTEVENLRNYILKAQAQEKELREFKATIKELLDIPITVSTFNGTSLLVKTMNKLNKLVGEEDE